MIRPGSVDVTSHGGGIMIFRAAAAGEILRPRLTVRRRVRRSRLTESDVTPTRRVGRRPGPAHGRGLSPSLCRGRRAAVAVKGSQWLRISAAARGDS